MTGEHLPRFPEKTERFGPLSDGASAHTGVGSQVHVQRSLSPAIHGFQCRSTGLDYRVLGGAPKPHTRRIIALSNVVLIRHPQDSRDMIGVHAWVS